jgi:hypothetical protein
MLYKIVVGRGFMLSAFFNVLLLHFLLVYNLDFFSPKVYDHRICTLSLHSLK